MKEVDRRGEAEWLQVVLPLHDEIAPIIHRICNVDAEGIPTAGLTDYLEAVEKLPPVLKAMKKAPAPKAKELRMSKKAYERGLDSFIKASEWGVKLFRNPGRVRLANVVFFMSVGADLMEEATKAIAAFSERE